MKHQTGELGGNILVHTNCMDIQWHGRRLARMWRCVWGSFALQIIFCLGLGGQLPPAPSNDAPEPELVVILCSVLTQAYRHTTPSHNTA